MKIISKYKDFYDYLVQDHDADITFVREVKPHYEYLDDLFKKDNQYSSIFNRHYGYYSHFRNKKDPDGKISFENYIFGIYPYVYSQPIMLVKWTDIVDSVNHDIVILTKSVVDYLLHDVPKGIESLKKEADLLLDKHLRDGKMFKPVKSSVSTWGKISDSIRPYVWKIECPEIFKRLGSPVFVKYEYKLFENNIYNTELHATQQVHYVSGICFNKLNYNILKYWYDELNDLNTYINIENFLWSVKQEPISIPDNNTKILSHGFDLKTSFRNVK